MAIEELSPEQAQAMFAKQRRRCMLPYVAATVTMGVLVTLFIVWPRGEQHPGAAPADAADSGSDFRSRWVAAQRTIRAMATDYDRLEPYFASPTTGAGSQSFAPLSRGWVTQLGRRSQELVDQGKSRHDAVKQAAADGLMDRDMDAVSLVLNTLVTGSDTSTPEQRRDEAAATQEIIEMGRTFRMDDTIVGSYRRTMLTRLKGAETALESLYQTYRREQGLVDTENR